MASNENMLETKQFKDFDISLKESQLFPLEAYSIDILQINFGRLCNQTCKHCHVEAGPNQKEIISKDVLESCLDILKVYDITTVDITGGAPEMNPQFKWFVTETRKLGCYIIVRCNLTILLEKGFERLIQFYADNKVEIVASMPYYTEKQVDAQRGQGTFDKSIKALQLLNKAGYSSNPELNLNLVYNPRGAFLAPSQHAIEMDFKREFKNRFNIEFNNLYTITNMPIGRFHKFLQKTNNYNSYMERLINAYNPQAANGVMCRYTLSVDWNGNLFDCDFNQMLELSCNHDAPDHINNFNFEKLKTRRIVTGLHCYGCTAGAGSSCGGAVVEY